MLLPASFLTEIKPTIGMLGQYTRDELKDFEQWCASDRLQYKQKWVR